ncbi:hypothetical protein Dsin_010543 [Dipteronia sinensis]|uniref:BTB domain-containing protein n=1 Tax=Dipteronia sinensis TaxID=43782 RepID=A0AAE0AT02_9ROSI|nr:hypothetical protein Dsin_010543 [Dipteronia sinensis]
MAAEKSSSKGQAWFCTTGLPSDIVIEVDEMSFHLHKFPLMSKSRKLHQLIAEQETNPVNASRQDGDDDADNNNNETEIVEEEDEVEEEEEAECHISLPDFPGGSETFEMVAKWCYGVKMELSSSNVAPLRCAAEFLEMTDDYSEDNLISKTERFFSQSVFKSLNGLNQGLEILRNRPVFSRVFGHYSKMYRFNSFESFLCRSYSVWLAGD